MNIAIDGPAGAGKSTIAKRVSKKLGYVYVDTGAMYRTMALYFLRNQIDGSDEKAVSDSLDAVSVEIRYVDGEQKVLLNGEDVTSLIRTEEVGNMASATSKYPAVRAKLLELQRDLARKMDVVMDGRDIGTTILPDAEVKIYLTASVEARGKRRFEELQAKGVACDFEQIKKDIEDRDYRDMHREVSPLKQAEDAYYLDSSNMNIEEVTEAIINRINER
jgi:cytidylate kinase